MNATPHLWNYFCVKFVYLGLFILLVSVIMNERRFGKKYCLLISLKNTMVNTYGRN